MRRRGDVVGLTRGVEKRRGRQWGFRLQRSRLRL